MDRRLFSITLLALIMGCAISPHRVAIFSPSKPEVLMCYDALQTSVGVAPLVDHRAAFQKAGAKPRGLYLLLWNQRIGDYVTSDKDFLDASMLSAMSEQIGYHLSKTNCFFETKALTAEVPLQPSPERLLVVLAKEKVRYVLTGELKHFYGKQPQKAYFYALPAYFVDLFGIGSQVGTAKGHTEILFTLYETESGQEVWREEVSGEASSAVAGSYPEVARESFAKASQSLANQLYRFAQLKQGSALIPKPEGI